MDNIAEKEKKTFIIPVEWSVYSTVRVEAETLDEAIARFNRVIDNIPITPNECEYIDESYRINGEGIDDILSAQSYRDSSSIVIKSDDSSVK